MTQPYVTVSCYVRDDCCLLLAIRFMAALSVYVLCKCIPKFLGLFLLLIWLLHPPLPTTTKHLYISANASHSKYSSRKLAHFLPICMKTMTVAVKQGQQGPDNMGFKKHCQAGMKCLLFFTRQKLKTILFKASDPDRLILNWVHFLKKHFNLFFFLIQCIYLLVNNLACDLQNEELNIFCAIMKMLISVILSGVMRDIISRTFSKTRSVIVEIVYIAVQMKLIMLQLDRNYNYSYLACRGKGNLQ